MADRNVASGNTLSGISLKGSGNTVTGNVAGLLPDGSTVAANTLDGITLAAASQIIGGAAAGQGNVASGSLFIAVDTPLGPAYLAYGHTMDGNSNFYFYLGKR